LWPHSPQNLNPGGFEELHFGQVFSSLAPQPPQNFIPSGFSNWHFGHFILGASRSKNGQFERKGGVF
jgi:hypothetical protein